MKRPSYEGVFEGWEIGIAKSLIEKIRCGSVYLQREGFDDLLQTCLTHWYFAKDKYDPSAGASRQTFMYGVIKNKLLNIAEELNSDKRRFLTEALSLNQPLSDDEDASILMDTLSDEGDYAARLRIRCSLKIDIARILPKLNQRQRKLCRLLGDKDLNVKEASEVLKTPRGTLYEDIKRIKGIFEKERLRGYLR